MSIYKGNEIVSGRGGRPGPPGMNSSGGSDMGSVIIPIASSSWLNNGEDFIRVITPAEHGMAASPALLAFTSEYNQDFTQLERIGGFQAAATDGTITLKSSYPWQGICVVAGGISQALDAVARQSIKDEGDRAVRAEEALQAAVDDEEARATAAETQVLADAKSYTDKKIADDVPAIVQIETDRAKQAESNLQTAVGNEVTRATAAEAKALADAKSYADAQIPAAVLVEKTRATEAESSLQTAIGAETTRATQAEAQALANAKSYTDAQIPMKIKVESDRAKQAESDLQTAIEAETTRATQGEAQALASAKTYTDNQIPIKVKVETDRAKQAESELQAAINGEETRAIAAEVQTLASAKSYADEKIADAVAATQTWLPSVDTFAKLPAITDTQKTYLCRVTGSNDVYQCVAGQTAWALYSDNTDYVDEIELAAAVKVEADRAKQAESELQADIGAETTRATTAEAQTLANAKTYTDTKTAETVSAAVKTESDRAKGVESDLQAAVDEERTRATNAEAQTLASAKAYTDAQIPPAVKTETDRAKGAESTLQTAIGNEVTRATAAEAQVLADAKSYTDKKIADDVPAAVQVETARAQQAESNLQTAIDGEETRATQAEAQTLANAKSYTDTKIADTVPAAVQTETTRAAGAEQALDEKIDRQTARLPSYATAGTGSAYTITASELGTAYVNGMTFEFVPHTNSTGTPTLNVNSLGAKGLYIKSTSGTSKRAYTSLVSGNSYLVAYGTTDNGWVLLNVSYPDYSEVLNTPPLYSATGQAVNGAMTQKATTDAINAIAAGAFVPYVAAVTWSGSVNNYSYNLPASVHGKGTTPAVVTLLNGTTIDCSPYIDSAGNITIYSNANLTNIKMEVR